MSVLRMRAGASELKRQAEDRCKQAITHGSRRLMLKKQSNEAADEAAKRGGGLAAVLHGVAQTLAREEHDEHHAAGPDLGVAAAEPFSFNRGIGRRRRQLVLAKEAEQHQGHRVECTVAESPRVTKARWSPSRLRLRRALYMATAEVMTHGQDDLQATGIGGVSLFHVVIEEMS
ncbi:unnamed protein product [Miscanthus lutarioriparius]|uniref:Uncharacterized protein n=1 Tax=Miscanthus lutarioriparius TaxID=422564 RepID=A0A811SC71_9POAL|nr:unnamed protein product [Miscanthus lutarioriparius]